MALDGPGTYLLVLESVEPGKTGGGTLLERSVRTNQVWKVVADLVEYKKGIWQYDNPSSVISIAQPVNWAFPEYKDTCFVGHTHFRFSFDENPQNIKGIVVISEGIAKNPNKSNCPMPSPARLAEPKGMSCTRY